MSPLILPKDKPQIIKFSSYKTNDIVAFSKWGRIVIHRLVYIHPFENYFVTMGDNNLKADGKIKRSRILGKVDKIERNTQNIKIDHIYLSQSVNYLNQLTKINEVFGKKKLNYIILKGLPIHLHYSNKPPDRLYFDVDLLIKKKDLSKCEEILKKLGFKRVPTTLFKKSVKTTSQFSYHKKTRPFEVIVDLHLEPAIAFTKIKVLNKLLPETKQFTKHLFKNFQKVKVEKSRFPILKTDTLVVYLLLHFYHHNFNGIHRLEFINTIIKRGKINWDNISKTAKRFNFENLIYSGILMLQKYYKTKIPSSFIKEITPSFFPMFLATMIAKANNPFNSGDRTQEGIKRFLLVLLLSPIPITRKLKIITNKETLSYILPSINSLLSSSFKKSRKSFSASL